MSESFSPHDATEKAKASNEPHRYSPPRQYPRWMMFAGARPYRIVMKLLHAHGWCYPEKSLIAPGAVWCHWCGMRGKR